jgi:hypothetical protein
MLAHLRTKLQTHGGTSMQSIRRDLAIGLGLSTLAFVCALAWGSPFVAAKSDPAPAAAQAQQPSPSQPSPGQTQPSPDQSQPPQQTQPAPDQGQAPQQTQPAPDQGQPSSPSDPSQRGKDQPNPNQPPDQNQPNQNQTPDQNQPPSQSQPPSSQPHAQTISQVTGQAETQTGPSTQAGASQGQQQSQVFTGTIVKTGRRYCLRDSSGQVYKLDDVEGAKAYAGKSVKVTGQLDQQAMLIHVQNIQSAQT